MILSLVHRLYPISLQNDKYFHRFYTIICCCYLALYTCFGSWVILLFNVDLGFFLYKFVKHSTQSSTRSEPLEDNVQEPTKNILKQLLTPRQPEWEAEHFQPYVPTVQDAMKTVSKTIFST